MTNKPHIRILIVIVTLLLAFVVHAEPRAVHTGSAAQTLYANWMRWVPDSTPLSIISNPGTHDTMSLYGGPITETQSMPLFEQLRAGLRNFDIRARHIDDRFAIHHGSIFQNAMFGDVLIACNLFLDLNPTETIVLWISNAGVPEARNVTRNYWETFKWYRDQSGLGSKIYRTSNSFLRDLPLGQARGKIVIIHDGNIDGENCDSCGINANTLFQNESGPVATAFNMQAKWVAIIEQALFTDAGHAGSIYENSTTGSSGGVYPIDLANGLLGYEGMNYRYLKYLFTGNQRRTAGLFGMDFPGAGLIAGIIAHNLKFATNLSLVGSDFGKILNDIAYSATGEGVDGSANHALQIQNFLKHVLPSERWTTLVSADAGPANWGVSSDSEGLFAQTYNIEGFTHFALGAHNLNATITASELNAYLTPAALASLSGNAVARATGAKNLLKARFPHARWHVAVKQFPFDTSRWSARIDAAVSASVAVFDDGASYLYTAWATSSSNRPPVVVTTAPLQVDEGVEVTIKADDSSDPDGDALQYRWDFDGNGTWDTEYLPGPYITHTFTDNSNWSPNIEIFDGITSVSQKIGLTVRNVAPTFNTESTIALGTGSLLAREFNIVDPGADTWRVSINYGDGTPRVDLNLTNRTFRIDHQFPPNGDYNLRIEVRDDDDGQSLTSFRVVTDVPQLEIAKLGNTGQISWANHAAPFRLESSILSDPLIWHPVSATPVQISGRKMLEIEVASSNRIFRLVVP